MVDLPPGLRQEELVAPVNAADATTVLLPQPGQLVVLYTTEPGPAIRIDPNGNPLGGPFQLPAGFLITETIHCALTCQWIGSWIFQVQTDGGPSRWVRPYSGPTTVPVWEAVPDELISSRQSG